MIMCRGARTRPWPAPPGRPPQQFLPRFGTACPFPDTLRRDADTPLLQQLRAVAKLVEKADAETAAGYVKSGYLWSSGSLMVRAAVVLDEYRKVDTGSVEAVTDWVAKAGSDLGFIKLDTGTFASAKSTSI